MRHAAIRHLIRSASLNGYVPVARAVGLDPDAMLASVGLHARMLLDPDMRISATAVGRLLESSAQQSGAQDFGLRIAETRQLSNLGPLGLVAQQEPTLRGALEAMFRYLRLHNESLQLRIEEAEGVVVISQTLVTGRPVPARQSTELSLGALHRIVASMLGGNWRPRRICFTHPAPADLSTHRRVFGAAPLAFGQDFDGIVCGARDLEQPIPSADPTLARYAREYVDGLARGNDGGALTHRVQHLVRTLLPSGRCTADRIAAVLGVDRRTVHRHLSREGTSFIALLNDVRDEMVLRYVTGSRRSLSEISDLMGFASLSAFSGWFASRHGCSASEWRRRSVEKASQTAPRGEVAALRGTAAPPGRGRRAITSSS